MLVEIWSDVVCPWCYIGKRRFETALHRFDHADEVEVRWRSFELDPRAPSLRARTMPEHLAVKYGMTVEQAGERLEHMNRLAAAEGLTYDLAKTQGGNTFDAHRLVHLASSKDPAIGAALEEALFKVYFTDLQPIGDKGVLHKVAVQSGLDPQEVSEVLDSDRFTEEIRRDEAEAAELGCTGVPFFVIDRTFAVPGAQDADVFLVALGRAWERSHPGLQIVQAEDAAGTTAGQDSPESCTDDACAI